MITERAATLKGRECIAVISEDGLSALVFEHVYREYWECAGGYAIVNDQLVDKTDQSRVVGKLLTNKVNWDRI